MVVKMNDLSKIIGMRDTNNKYKENFRELMNTNRPDIPEIEQIKKGYSNILIVSSILKYRAESLLALINN